MNIHDAIYGRRAIRDFTEAAPGRTDIEAVIDAAIQAPSGVNRQPWAFVVTMGRPTLARFSGLAKAHLLPSIAKDSPLHGFREHLEDETFNIFYNAPVLVVISATDKDLMSLKDCCLAAQNVMLAALDRGLGSCWIGFSEAWLGTPEGKAQLGIPEKHIPVAPIILGRPATMPPAPARRAAEIRWQEPAAEA